jgi:hypothetical protein
MKLPTFILLILTLPVFSEKQSIIIPAIHIPTKHIPAIHIPGKHIPAKTIPFGMIDAIDISGIDIPAIDIPAVDTTSSVYVYEDFKIDKIEKYKKTAPVSNTIVPKYPRTFSEERSTTYLTTTKWATRDIVDIFTRFDVDHSGILTWDEVETFQQYIFQKYKYLSNSTALRPDSFLTQGGGDCEDWALLSCEFFRYWGWDAFVAGFFNEKEGHAVCFVKAEQVIPDAYIKYYLSGDRTLEGDSIPAGWYVPVDYFAVGSYSNAVEAGMKLTEYLTPYKVYGSSL